MKPRTFRSLAGLQDAIARGELTGPLHLLVLHDDTCIPDRCTCEPSYVVEALTTETYALGQQAQARWMRGARP